jgi:hypothetical protein
MPLRRDRREARQQAAAIQGASKLAHSKGALGMRYLTRPWSGEALLSPVPIQLSPALVSWFLVFLIYGFIILVPRSSMERLGNDHETERHRLVYVL